MPHFSLCLLQKGSFLPQCVIQVDTYVHVVRYKIKNRNVCYSFNYHYSGKFAQNYGCECLWIYSNIADHTSDKQCTLLASASCVYV